MKVAVLGTGNMGRALISGLKKAYSEKVDIVAFDLNEKARCGLNAEVLPPVDWFKNSDIPDVVIIAVKPSDISAAILSFSSVNDSLKIKPLWLSIAAGINIASLQSHLPAGARICRVMPNTPALVGEGMSAYALNLECHDSDKKNVEMVLSACGKCVNVPEKLMNAVTGLSGSGPAYVYLFVEALIEGGVMAGLPYAIAKESALQTVLGSVKMIQETGENPNTLKVKVMSPAGTTASGLAALESHAFKYAVITAVTEATKRSEQLGA